MEGTPRTGLTRLAQEVGVSISTTYRILTEDIALFPYKLQMFQELSPLAQEKRLAFAETFGAHVDAHRSVLPFIWLSDEAHFWLHGYVNKQNCRIWSTENPQAFLTKPLHPKRLTVWAALSSKGIIGPIFIDGNVTGDSYQKMLKEEVIPALRNRRNFKNLFFNKMERNFTQQPKHWSCCMKHSNVE